MILIVGGRAQGKSKIAMEYAEPEAVLLHLENVIARVYETGSGEEADWDALRSRAEKAAKTICSDPKIRVITADEIGSGVVPMERREREYRDAYGRILQEIASGADRVLRVVCGIPVEIYRKDNGMEGDPEVPEDPG